MIEFRHDVGERDTKMSAMATDALAFCALWYTKIPDAIGYAEFYSGSHHAVIRVYDHVGNVIETHEQAGDFTEP